MSGNVLSFPSAGRKAKVRAERCGHINRHHPNVPCQLRVGHDGERHKSRGKTDDGEMGTLWWLDEEHYAYFDRDMPEGVDRPGEEKHHAKALAAGQRGWGTVGSAANHERYALPVRSRRKCLCGCGGRQTHTGFANGVALTSGCELRVTRWVREGKS